MFLRFLPHFGPPGGQAARFCEILARNYASGAAAPGTAAPEAAPPGTAAPGV